MSCAVVPSTYRSNTTRCITRVALFLKQCTRYFFQRDTSSESNCNRNFRGQPSGWNWLIFVMCTSTLVCSSLQNYKIDTISYYPPICNTHFYIAHYFQSLCLIGKQLLQVKFFLVKINHDGGPVKHILSLLNTR